jgi:oligosaccharide repeat unit polymerase
MRSVLSSPWVSSLAVLAVFGLVASAVTLSMSGPLSASDLMLVLLIGTYVVALWYRCAQHPDDLVEMDTAFLMFLGVYLVLPIVAFVIWQALGDTPVFVNLVAHFESDVIVVAMAALLAFLLGSSSIIGTAFTTLLPRADGAWRRSEGLAISAGLLLIGSALMVALVGRVGLEIFTESEYVRTFEATAGLGVLAGGAMLLQLGLVVLSLTLAERGRRASILPLVLFAVLALLLFRIGLRRIVLETGLALLVAHHFSVRRIPRRALAIGAAAALLVFSVVGLARNYLAEGFVGMVTRVTEEFGVLAAVDLMAEPITVLLALTETMYQIPDQEPFWLGRTFVEAFEILVPLPLYPDRPLAPSQWFVNLIDPAVAAAGGGYAYALLAEGYLNFGVAGVVAVSFLEGVAVRALVSYRRLVSSSKSRILIYAIAVSLTISMIRGDFASLLKVGIVSLALPATLIAAWLGRRKTSTASLTDGRFPSEKQRSLR